MSNLEKLKALCRKENRGIHISESICADEKYVSVLVTESGIFGSIDKSMGGTASLEEYAGLMLDLLEPKLRIVK